MKRSWLFARRNLRLFLLDPMAVFFAFLSSLILIIIYALFLGKVQLDTLKQLLQASGEIDGGHRFIASWVIAGLVLITSVTTPLAACIVYAQDRENKAWKDIFISPFKRSQIVFGYLLQSLAVGFSMTCLTYFAGLIFLRILGVEFPKVGNFFLVLGYILLLSLLFSTMSTLIVSFLRTHTGFTGVSIVVGVAVGFLATAYVVPGLLYKGVLNVISFLPYNQGSLILRGPITEAALDSLGRSATEVQKIKEHYGIVWVFDGNEVSSTLLALSLLAMAVVFALFSVWRVSASIKR